MIRKIRDRLRDRYLLQKYVQPFAYGNDGRLINPENNICLFCQPRGGSAWLSEIIGTLPYSGIIDEPLWSGPYSRSDMMPNERKRKLKALNDLNFYFNQPIPEHEQWPEAYKVFEKLLKGQQPSLYLYEEMDLERLSTYQTYITKFNKANLLFHWLRSSFDFKSIVLLRHPCATISSQILGRHFPDAVPIHSSITPHFRYSDYFQQYSEIWRSIGTQEEYLAFIWSVNTKEVVSHKDRNDDYLIVCYESLLTRFDFEVERIFRYLERPIPAGIQNAHKKPSPTTQPTSLEPLESGRQLGAWRDLLPPKKTANILRVMKSFDIDFYDEGLGVDYDTIYTKNH